MMGGDLLDDPIQQQLSNLFGGYRAEWLKEQIFDLFTEPSYFPELKTPRPCIIQGGRGTGKTTVLRGLSYEGQFAFSKYDPQDVPKWAFYGMYYRANTNIVTAFRGSELSDDEWVSHFAHYFNLLLCGLLLNFLEWYQVTTATVIDVGRAGYQTIAAALNTVEPKDLKELSAHLALARRSFEAYINNVADAKPPLLTVQGAPVDVLIESLVALPQFRGKTFFFLIDEYENFEPYQQQVINTLLKHSGQHYTFKVSVRELGIRSRTTLNPNEQLMSPSDYVSFDIKQKLSGEQFRRFALEVCNERIAKLKLPNCQPPPSIEYLLPGLTEDEEADLLGIDVAIADMLSKAEIAQAKGSGIKSLELYFLVTWANDHDTTLADVLAQFIADPKRWTTRYNNYRHSLLFAIRAGKRGPRRYYCGWKTFTYLAASNIRYLLELVEQSLLLHVNAKLSLAEPVSPETQTEAAQSVGKKNLADLEGLAVSGAQLMRLLLGLGRVFGQMAAQPVGHAPEVNQFALANGDEWSENPASVSFRAENLLKAAVMHLALLRWPGTKLGAPSDTRDYDYAIHPIFSAYFEFSYRRKRKMLLSADEILGLVRSPSKSISDILAKNNREEQPLPAQLQIFQAYFDGDS